MTISTKWILVFVIEIWPLFATEQIQYPPAIQIDMDALQELPNNSDFFVNTLAYELKTYPTNETLENLSKQYLNKLKTGRYGSNATFIVCRQSPEPFEGHKIHNPETIKDDTLVHINNGLISFQNQIISTQSDDAMYAIDPTGQLCIWTPEIHHKTIPYIFHSYFFKQNGIGTLIACGGHIKISEGKITAIDTRSGHYQPAFLQLAFVVRYLYNLGVIDPNIQISDFLPNFHLSLEQTLKLTEIFRISPVTPPSMGQD